jgi:biotin carboxyl carrier protein
MDIRKVKKLIELLEESNIGEIEIKEGEESVRISRNGNQNMMPAQAPMYAAPPVAAPVAPAAAAFSRRLAPLPAQTANRVCWRGEPPGAGRETCITPPPRFGRTVAAISSAVRGVESDATRPEPTRGSPGIAAREITSNAGSS